MVRAIEQEVFKCEKDGEARKRMNGWRKYRRSGVGVRTRTNGQEGEDWGDNKRAGDKRRRGFSWELAYFF